MASTDTRLARQVSVKDYLPGPETLRGIIPLQLLDRLRPSLLVDSESSAQRGLETDEAVRATLVFERDLAGSVWLGFELSVRLPMECQRCLQDMVWQGDMKGRWALSGSSDLEADLLELEDGMLDLWQAVEDEVLLSLPMAPMHAHDCAGGATEVAEGVDDTGVEAHVTETRRPFAGLDELIKERNANDGD